MLSCKAGRFFVVFLAVAVWMLIGCEMAIDEPSTGRVVGKAIFLNNDSHEDIIVSLEILEKGITRNVSRAINGITSDADSRSLTAQTKTKANGEFSFESVPEGSYTLYASSKDSKEQAVHTSLQVVKGRTVTAPDLQLTAVGDIKGRIVLDGTETGNIGFIVFIAGTSYMAITNDNGDFTISSVPSGDEYAIIIMRGTDTYQWSETIEVEAGKIAQLGAKNLVSEDFPGIVSIIWKGELTSAPTNPQLNWAYYNLTAGKSYIYDGTIWQVLAQDGNDGMDGEDGISIIWKGELTTHPGSPQLNWAYYNSTDKVSYIYDGSAWQVLARDGWVGPTGPTGPTGEPGVSIIWKGELSAAPSTPELNWAYYNLTAGNSYIYDGTIWQVLAKDGNDGIDGEDGKTAVWIKYDSNQGESGTAPDIEYLYAGDSTTIKNNTGNLSRTGYIFSGWNSEANGEGADYTIGSSLILEESRTLYAKWTVTVGGPGQAGGIIFYDDESDGIDNNPGFRYLEAAPADWNDMGEDTTYIFGYYRTTWDGENLSVGTSTNIGAGMSNTMGLVEKMGDIIFDNPSGTSTKTTVYAAKICADLQLENDGITYDDWFLPSREELALMYNNLKKNNLGGFSDANYWSSTEKLTLYAAFIDFISGQNYDGYRYSDFRIRPIRAF